MSDRTDATDLNCFEGVEEPMVRVVVEPDDFQNITPVARGVFRMTLRHFSGNGTWWDGDRSTTNGDRQRAEVKGLGRHQHTGETFKYGTTWRSSPLLKGTSRFCHIFQLKATEDTGPPLVTLSILAGSGHAAVQYTKADTRRTVDQVCAFDWVAETWQSVSIRIRPSAEADGEIQVTVDGHDFPVLSGVVLHVPHRDEYRPKWGFYRFVSDELRDGEDFVEHKDIFAEVV